MKMVQFKLYAGAFALGMAFGLIAALWYRAAQLAQ